MVKRRLESEKELMFRREAALAILFEDGTLNAAYTDVSGLSFKEKMNVVETVYPEFAHALQNPNPIYSFASSKKDDNDLKAYALMKVLITAYPDKINERDPVTKKTPLEKAQNNDVKNCLIDNKHLIKKKIASRAIAKIKQKIHFSGLKREAKKAEKERKREIKKSGEFDRDFIEPETDKESKSKSSQVDYAQSGRPQTDDGNGNYARFSTATSAGSESYAKFSTATAEGAAKPQDPPLVTLIEQIRAEQKTKPMNAQESRSFDDLCMGLRDLIAKKEIPEDKKMPIAMGKLEDFYKENHLANPKLSEIIGQVLLKNGKTEQDLKSLETPAQSTMPGRALHSSHQAALSKPAPAASPETPEQSHYTKFGNN